MKRLIVLTAVTAALAGCSTAQTRTAETPLPSPTPAVTKDQTLAAAGKVDAPMTIDLPSWYIKAPASTEDFVFISGTGVSSDLSMSHQKALLDAQLKLADKINGVLNALVKSNKDDTAGTVNSDRTSVTIKKVITDTAITGYHIEDSRVLTENRGYRTFVLVRYPVGDANRMLKEKLQRENQQNQTSEDAAQRELEQEINRSKRPSARVEPASKVEPITAPVSRAPTNSVPVAGGGELKLMEVDNAEYRARREAALQKDGAFVGQSTIR